jgi:HlyD family secretion protein
MDNETQSRSSAFGSTAQQDRPRDQRKKSRWLWPTLAIGLAAIVWAISAIAPWFQAGASVRASELQFGTVTRGAFVADVSGYAQVVAARAPTLFAPAAGSVRYQVEPGQQVRTGDVLAVIDSPSLLATLAQEQSALDAARAEAGRQRVANERAVLEKTRARDQAGILLTAAKRERERAERAYAVQAISQVDYLRAQDAFDAAQLTLKHADRDIALERQALRLELDNRESLVRRQSFLVDALEEKRKALEIRAPFDGVVGTRAAAERAQLLADAAVISVVDLSQFELDLAVGELYAPLLTPGLSAEVEHEGAKLKADLKGVAAEVIGGQVTLRLRFVDQMPASLKQNQRVLTRVELSRTSDALMVPRGAYLSDFNGKAIWRKRGNQLERTPIVLGAIGADLVEIQSGLQVGDTVVLSNVKTKPEQQQLYLH